MIGAAPSSTVINVLLSQKRTSGFVHAGAPAQMFVATRPGCTLLDVTLVPTSRRACSEAKSTLASFDQAYARRI